jgi:hypothetical protein
MSDKFDEFIQKHIASETGGGTFDPEAEKAMWLGKLQALYALVKASLSEHIDAGKVTLTFQEIALMEEALGVYKVLEASISIGRQVVKLTPVGTFLIGARGRVDMRGPRGVARFLIVPPGSTAPRVRVAVVEPGKPPPAREAVAPPETWVWKIAGSPPRITYADLTPDSFRDVLMGVMDG